MKHFLVLLRTGYYGIQVAQLFKQIISWFGVPTEGKYTNLVYW